jgi:hypothetical protein
MTKTASSGRADTMSAQNQETGFHSKIDSHTNVA